MKSIKEAMEEAGYEEITEEEVEKLSYYEWVKFIDQEGRNSFFKKKEEPKFPKTFEDDEYKINVSKDNIVIDHKYIRHQFHFHIYLSIPLLEQAIDYRREHTKEVKA